MNNVRNSEKKLVVLSAPSGAGKSSLLNNVISQHHDIGLTISHTTRDIRPSEKNNIDYYFISKEKFQAMINEEEFIEFAEVHGNYVMINDVFEESVTNLTEILYDVDMRLINSNHVDLIKPFL